MKLVVKLSVVARGEHFGVEQQSQLAIVQRQVHHLCLTVLSFGKVAYSYDRSYLLAILDETHKKLLPLVTCCLSEKSRRRLDMIFEHLSKVSVSFFKHLSPKAASFMEVAFRHIVVFI